MTLLSLQGSYRSAYDEHIYSSRKRRLERRKIGRRVVICILAVVLTVSWLGMRFRHFIKPYGVTGIDNTFNVGLDEEKYWKRKLSSSATSCKRADDLAGYIIGLEVVAVLYLFIGLAVVCDEYFQMSLETISLALNLMPDVAGATFLAAGSSAPELFTSLADAFGSKNSIGTGTIVGSAMFNILVIVALSAAIAGKGGVWLAVDWRPVCRDVSFYVYSIGLLAFIFLNDSAVTLVEAFVMVGSYGVYIVFMKFNSYFLDQCKSRKVDNESDVEEAIERAEEAIALSLHMSSIDSLSMSCGLDTSVRRQTMGIRHRQGSFMLDGSQRRSSQTMGIRHRARKYRKHRTSWKGAVVAVMAARKFAHKRVWEHAPRDMTVAPGTGSNHSSMRVEKPRASLDQSGTPSTTEGSPSEEKEIQEYKYDNISSSGLSEAPPQIFGKPDSNGESSFGVKQCGSEQETVEEEEQSRFTWPDSLFDRIIYVLSFPYLVAFALTIPDCGKGSEIYSCCGNSTTIRWEKLYVGTFFMSIVWIALLTFIMVWMATDIGCYLGISPVIMGIVFLAAGTSVPDAMGSMIAARDGQADMAIANAIGSNVFDILLGLGFPWLLSNIYFKKRVAVDTDQLVKNIVILLCTVALFVIVLLVNNWRINTFVGVCLFTLYVAFVIYSVISGI